MARIFNLPIPSSRNITLGSTQPVTEIAGGKEQPARKADKLTAIYEPIVEKMWEPRRITTPWAPTACYRDSVTFTLQLFHMQNGNSFLL
jgi:hypothetical protein